MADVTLIDPDGNEVTVSDPATVNNLVFGRGYKPKDKKATVESVTAPPDEKKKG